MTTLKNWYSKKLAFPLVGLALLMTFALFFALFREMTQRNHEISNLVSKTTDFLNLAFDQHNNTLIEVALSNLMEQSKAEGVAICDGPKEYLSLGGSNLCSSPKELLVSYETFPLPALIGKNIVLKSSYLNVYREMLALFGFSGILLISVLGISHYTLKRFSNEILVPMTAGLTSSEKLNIYEFEAIRRKYLSFLDTEKKQAVLEAIMERNAQVAHDIRSPLSALNMVARVGFSSNESVGPLFTKAVSRITEIANDLKNQNSALLTTGSSANDSENSMNFIIQDSVKALIEEKKFEYFDMQNLKITFYDHTQKARVQGQESEFNRAISNLINNAAEALGESTLKKIFVTIEHKGKSIEITISDNGPGFPEQMLNSFGQRGSSLNKPGGSGLGLYHAVKTTNAMNGQINIKNLQDPKGAAVTILLPII